MRRRDGRLHEDDNEPMPNDYTAMTTQDLQLKCTTIETTLKTVKDDDARSAALADLPPVHAEMVKRGLTIDKSVCSGDCNHK